VRDHDEYGQYDLRDLVVHSMDNALFQSIPPSPPTASAMTVPRMVLILTTMNMISLFGNCMWYTSLGLTVVSLNNTIYQSNCVFVLLFSFLLLDEQLTFKKFFACIVSIGGVVMVTFSMPLDANSPSGNSVVGIICDVVACVLWAVWEVGFTFITTKHLQMTNRMADTLLFMVGIGAVNLLLFWPSLVLLHYAGIESFELPPDDEAILSIVILIGLDILFCISLLYGIALCSPIFMSMGMVLVIPITFFADIIVFRKQSMDIINVYSMVGAACIIFGFVLIQQGHAKSEEERIRKPSCIRSFVAQCNAG